MRVMPDAKFTISDSKAQFDFDALEQSLMDKV
jgi:hypothetical protein